MKEGVRIVLYYGMCALAVGVFFLALNFDFRMTGKSVNERGNLSLFIEGVFDITIHSPLNITYNFSADEPFTIWLNVSSSFSPDAWRFSLYDLTDDVFLISERSFTPNATFNATRWGNRLEVFAQRQTGEWVSKEVVFYVSVPNSAPILGYIADEIYACEETELRYFFNASDVDRDDLTGDISPRAPFYVVADKAREKEVSFFRIISGILKKHRVGNYSRVVFVNDNYNSSCCVDTKNVVITVIEINNEPALEGLGAQTLWTRGESSTFYHQMIVNDIEDGNSSDGKLHFNISFWGGEDLFEIDNFGIMNYTVRENDTIGVYNITVCVADNPLSYVHPQIGRCYPNDGDANSVCDNFSITITDENRPPQIINYTPYENFTIRGTDIAGFTVEVYDPDGTIPDINWYVDSVLKQRVEMRPNDSFNYFFGCDVRGEHNVTIVASDGELNVSHTWIVGVELVLCAPDRAPSGGGGIGAPFCLEQWVCDEWGLCQNLKRSFNIGLLSQKEYYDYNEICLQEEFSEIFCGFQIRNCYDLNECNNSVFKIPKPEQLQVCYFTEEPSCFDGIKNCHSGGCEIMIDCGGPCPPCPTCSDGIQNQGEEGIDCGGPCPFPCEPEFPLRNILFLILLIILIAIIILIIIKAKKIRDYRKNRSFFGDRFKGLERNI